MAKVPKICNKIQAPNDQNNLTYLNNLFYLNHITKGAFTGKKKSTACDR